MKRRIWLPLIFLMLALLIFGAYRVYDQHITDNRAPQIAIEQTEGLLQVSVADPESVLLQGVTATDARDGDVTASVIVESVNNINDENQVTVTYAAFDRAGNVAKAQRVVQYTDYQSPRFTLNTPLAYAYGSRFDVLENIGAWDELEGDISRRVKATLLDDVAISAEGTHDVQFRVTNNLGDTVDIVLPVEVYRADDYAAQLVLTDYIVYLPKNSVFIYRDYLKEFNLFGESTSLTGGLPEGMQMKTKGTVNTRKEGVYDVSYWVTGELDGRSYTGYSRLIVVIEG